MRLALEADEEPVPWVGNRNFIVPPDVIPVRRVSPIPQKKRTLCRPRAEGEPVVRAGAREWFSGQLFVDRESCDLRTLYGGSMSVHASCLIGLLVLLAGPSASTTPVRVSSPLQMPAFIAIRADGGGGSGPQFTVAAPERREVPPAKGVEVKAKPVKAPTVAPPPDPAAPEPVDNFDRNDPAEPTRKEESADTPAENLENARVGTPGGVPGGEGAATGAGNGSGVGSGGAGAGIGKGSSGPGTSVGPYKLGNGIEPPRKIKDVRPAYPSDAMTARARGTVVIEAVVGADGKVHDVKVTHSIPLLDQAALDAVRQWEFEPSRLNGTAVAVIVTVLVQFSFH